MNKTYNSEILNSYSNWHLAKNASLNNDYDAALQYMHQALNDDKTIDKIFLQLERAKINQMNGDLEGCLTEINDVILQAEMGRKFDDNYIKALYGAISIYASRDLEKASSIYKKILEHDKSIPIVTVEENVMIFENTSNLYSCRLVQDLIKKNLIIVAVCESDADISFLETGTIIVKMKPCFAKNFKKKLPQNHLKQEDTHKVEWCKDHCTTAATAAFMLCGYLPTTRCRAACTIAVEALRKGCCFCCEEGNFYVKCIKPLEKYFPPPCDPIWD